MRFNYDKFEALRYKNSDAVLEKYTINDNEIEEKEHIKDLGVWLSNDGTFSYHITQKCKSGNQMVGWLLRTFDSRIPLT